MSPSPKYYLVTARERGTIHERSFVACLSPEEQSDLSRSISGLHFAEIDELDVAQTMAAQVRAGRALTSTLVVGQKEVRNLL